MQLKLQNAINALGIDKMTKTELAREIRAVSYLTGEFKLRSGMTSSFYWDKYRFVSNPVLLSAIAKELRQLCVSQMEHPNFGGFAGLELGGIPLATALSLQTGYPCFYVRKEAKTYGTCNLIEGGVEKGSTVVVVEDVVTTAGQVCMSIEQMREAGLKVEHVVSVIDRQSGGEAKINALGCTYASLFTPTELTF